MTQSMKLRDWWFELQRLSRAAGLEWLLGDQEDNRDAYDDGMTPKETLQELYADAEQELYADADYPGGGKPK
jgi:hypothetical protein